MPPMNEMFPSKYLSAGDLDDDGNVVTIEQVEEVTIKNRDTQRDEKKWLVTFREFDKGLILNVTNGKSISKIHGGESDDWIGEKIILYPTTTSFGGETRECIRVDEEATFKMLREAIKKATAKSPKKGLSADPEPSRQTAPPLTQAEADDAEEIPF